MYIFAGRDGKGSYFSDVFRYDFETNAWCEMKYTGTVPSRRYGHNSIVWYNGQETGNLMLVFGGLDVQRKYLNDVYVCEIGMKQLYELIQC